MSLSNIEVINRTSDFMGRKMNHFTLRSENKQKITSVFYLLYLMLKLVHDERTIATISGGNNRHGITYSHELTPQGHRRKYWTFSYATERKNEST